MNINNKNTKKEKRYLQILEILSSTPLSSVTGLADKLEVSDETIRNDLKSDYLKDKVIQTHGSVALNNSLSGTGIPFEFRKSVNYDRKNEIAKKACEMILPGNVVVIEHNTIGTMIVNNIVLHPELVSTITIITNSFSILSFLVESKIQIKLIFLGGNFIYNQKDTYGSTTISQMQELHGDIAFLCPAAISSDLLITAYDENEYLFKNSILKNCRTNVLLIDQSKYDKLALRTINHATDYDMVISNVAFTSEQKEIFKSNNTELIQMD